MCTVSIAIFVFITLRDCLAPVGAAFEVNVLNVGAGVDDVSINAFAAILSIEVLVEIAEAKSITVRDTGKAPRSVLLERRGAVHGPDFGVTFNVFNLSKRAREQMSQRR